MVADAGDLTFRPEDPAVKVNPQLPTQVAMGFEGGVYSGQLAMSVTFDEREFLVSDMRELAQHIREELMRFALTARACGATDSVTELT